MGGHLLYSPTTGHLLYNPASGHLLYGLGDVYVTFTGSITVQISPGGLGTFSGGTYLASRSGTTWQYLDMPNAVTLSFSGGLWWGVIARSWGSYGYGRSYWKSGNRLGLYTYDRSEGVDAEGESDDVTSVRVAEA